MDNYCNSDVPSAAFYPEPVQAISPETSDSCFDDLDDLLDEVDRKQRKKMKKLKKKEKKERRQLQEAVRNAEERSAVHQQQIQILSKMVSTLATGVNSQRETMLDYIADEKDVPDSILALARSQEAPLVKTILDDDLFSSLTRSSRKEGKRKWND